MHILVTNDDGIESPGLWHLAGALRAAGLGTVTIIAPDQERSGAGTSVPPQLEGDLVPVPPLAPQFEGIDAWASTGTPTSCVTVAMLEVVSPRADVVVSGINLGLNTGGNVTISGTVGAAMAGSLWGVPGLAVSVDFERGAPVAWETAAWAAAQLFPLLSRFGQHGGRHPLVWNVNVPNAPSPAAVRGFRQTDLAEVFYGTVLRVGEVRPNSRNGHRIRFAFDRDRLPRDVAPQLDYGAIQAGYVSVTLLAPVSVHPAPALNAALETLGVAP
ncbi:MAG: 5'/3'-nucleotidase SurE [Ardenticatenaceae bacterium]|nr:5'/3'-nucleotidase SurE [Ardenticatenaceae bacterium]